jgi:hypothetical protein
VWLVVGFFLLDPWLYPQESILMYSHRSLVFALLSSLLNALGAWALLAAMGNMAAGLDRSAFYGALSSLVTVSLAPLYYMSPSPHNRVLAWCAH